MTDMNENEKDIWERILNEARRKLIQEGWTPPEEKKWQPKEGELVQIRHLDNWISVSFESNFHPVRDCRPHPTHLCWEMGQYPAVHHDSVCILMPGGNVNRAISVGLEILSNDIIIWTDDQWARLPLEES